MYLGIDYDALCKSKEKLSFWDAQKLVYPALTTFDEFPIVDVNPQSPIAFDCPSLVVLNKLHLDSFRTDKQIYLLVNEFETKSNNPLKQLKLYIERKVGAVDWKRVTFVSVSPKPTLINSRIAQIREIVLYAFNMASQLTWVDAERATVDKEGYRLISIDFSYTPVIPAKRIQLNWDMKKLNSLKKEFEVE